jgi:hypothetical protein
MSEIRRRDMLKLMGVGAAALTAGCTPDEAGKAKDAAAAARDSAAAAANPKGNFFTAHERETAGILADLIIPRDDRSGSATEAGVVDFMDFILTEYPDNQIAIRGGLAWMNAECRRRHTRTFAECSDAERRALLDDIAWPKKAKPELSQGVAFFNRFRDFTASGFFSSRMGAEDLRYLGNKVVPVWDGCPPEALAKLGVSYS